MIDIQTISLMQRLSGLIAIGLITLQIYLGATRKAIWFHKINGIIAYTFILIHPSLLIIKNYLNYSKFDPFYVFVDACILCDGLYEHFLNFGRIAFYLITIAVLAVKLRDFFPWLKANWRKLHILNYVAFYFVSFHSINIGSDSRQAWFLIYFILCQLVVLYSIMMKLKNLSFVLKLKNKFGL